MRVDDFYFVSPTAGIWDSPFRELNDALVEQVHAGPIPGRTDVEAAVALARLVHDEYEKRGTDNSSQLTVEQSRGVMTALRTVLGRVGIRLSPPFGDFSQFNSYWRKEGATGSWQARRDILDALLNPVHDQLADMQAGAVTSTLAQPVSPRPRTGWTRVDEEIAELRRHFQAASSPQDYRNVGNDTVIVLERISEAAYEAARHLPTGEAEPPVPNTKARLDRVVEVELPGPGNAELRKLVRAAIEHAQAVKHRTPDRRHAGIAADAVILLANMMRRLSEPVGTAATPNAAPPP